MPNSISTPWGPSQQVRNIADGIDVVSTASHGGIRLSAARAKTLQALMPGQGTYAGSSSWFEEDLDANLVVLAFPEHFSEQALFNAVRAIRDWEAGYLDPAKAFLAGAGKNLVARADAFAATVNGRWEVTSYGSALDSSKPDSWGVGLRNTATGERKGVSFKQMPGRQFYSEAELQTVLA